jgi:hypothetical protein
MNKIDLPFVTSIAPKKLGSDGVNNGRSSEINLSLQKDSGNRIPDERASRDQCRVDFLHFHPQVEPLQCLLAWSVQDFLE